MAFIEIYRNKSVLSEHGINMYKLGSIVATAKYHYCDGIYSLIELYSHGIRRKIKSTGCGVSIKKLSQMQEKQFQHLYSLHEAFILQL